MRNYGGFGIRNVRDTDGGCGKPCNTDEYNRHEKPPLSYGENRRVRVVVEDNTIYEIDLDCLECKEKINK